MGGSKPITGSSVTLYQAGSAASPLATPLGSATTSTGTNPNSPAGSFTIQLSAAPPAGSILYLVASGGDAGGGANAAIELMSIIGQVGNGVAATGSVNATIDELTTVASAYVASNFISNETNIADNSFGALAGAVSGIGNLVNVQTGALGNTITSSNNDPTKLITLANALANCVQNLSGVCTGLFAAANAPSAPTDTLGAIININKNPVNNVGAIVNLGSSGPYAAPPMPTPPTPSATPTPSDLTLAVNFSGGGLNNPSGIAIDGSGNVWAANFGQGEEIIVGSSVTELSPSGAPLSPATGFTGGGLDGPEGIAIDGSGNVWVANYSGNSVTELFGGDTPTTCPSTPVSGDTGCPVPTSPFTVGGLSAPSGIAIDGSGNAWVTNGEVAGSVTELNSSGNAVAGPFPGGGELFEPSSIAIDGWGNVWVPNSYGGSVAELNSSGLPLSPIAGSDCLTNPADCGGFKGGGLDIPEGGVAIDGAGNAWLPNMGNSVTELAPSGVPLSSASGFSGGGLEFPRGIAIDGSGNVWAANEDSNSVTELNSSGAPLSPNAGAGCSGDNPVNCGGFTGGGLYHPDADGGIAIDGAGNVWVANPEKSSVTEIIGAGAPAKTPLAARLSPPIDIVGTVTGGSKPIAGSSVTLFEAAGPGGVENNLLGSAMTGPDGTFSIQLSPVPPQGTILYLVAGGGDAGGGANAAIGLMSIIGAVSGGPVNVTINELTTVAAAYAASNFISGETHIADNSFGALTGAVSSIANLVNVHTGALGSTITSGNNDPSKLITLANALANCVQNLSGACTNLFAAANVPSTPTDTLSAIININKNPTNNVSAIVSLGSSGPYAAPPTPTPATPSATPTPGDLTLAVNFTGGGLNTPGGIAIDASGNVWVPSTSSNSVTELNSSGAALSPASGFTGGGLDAPLLLAIDGLGNVWVSNEEGNSVTELNPSGAPLSGSGFTGGGLDVPAGIAIDSSGNVWVSNLSGSSVTELNSSGSPLSPNAGADCGTNPADCGGFTGGGLNFPDGVIAIDGSGNVWVSNYLLGDGNSVTELNSSGSPLSAAGGFTGGGLSAPLGVAIDSAGNVWVPNFNGNSVTELNPAGVPLSPNGGFTGGGLASPLGIAIDGANNVWVVNQSGNSVTELTPSGAPLSSASGLVGGALNAPVSIAIDGAGNVWASNSGNSSVTEIVGAGAPVQTPLVARLGSLPNKNVGLITTLPSVGGVGLATDGTNFYVDGSLTAATPCNGADQPGNAPPVGPSPSCNQGIFSVPVAGGGATFLYPAYNPYQIVTGSSDLFWIDPNAGPFTDTDILEAPASGMGPIGPIFVGSAVSGSFNPTPGRLDGSGLTSDGSSLYLADESSGAVFSINPNGTSLTQLAQPRYGPAFSLDHSNLLTVNGGTLYITDSGTDPSVSPPAILTLPVSGGSFSTLFSGPPFIDLQGIAVGPYLDTNAIFVADSGADTIWELPLAGGTPTALISGTPFVQPSGLLSFDGNLYVLDQGNATVPGAIYEIRFPQNRFIALPNP